MRKPIIFFMLLLLSLSSCGKDKDPSTLPTSEEVTTSETVTSEEETSEEVSSEEISSEVEVKGLDTPFARFNDETKVVTWDEVEDATHYNYIINDGEVQTTTSTTLTLENQSNVSIQAANTLTKSDWSNAVTCYDTSDVVVNVEKDIKVYFHNGGIPSKTIKKGEKVEKPTAPSKENYTFDNWYKDPYYKEVFNFDTPIYESTVIYAKWNESDLINDVYYWVKCDGKMTSSVQSSSTGWKYIPLKLANVTPHREFKVTVNVSGASSASPCAFLVVDGLDDNSGRTYWKNGNSDFTITTNGTYTITFSVETQYSKGIHVKYGVASNSASSKAVSDKEDIKLKTPVVTIDQESSLARWEEIDEATSYDVIINNGEIQNIKVNYINLPKGSHISVRAINDEDYSSWSLPKANINTIYNEIEEEITHVYAYFLESNQASSKVAINSSISNGPSMTKEGYSFDGWYLDIGLKNKVTFPYEMKENTVFYPKWTYQGNYSSEACYQLVYANGTKICDLVWNMENYDFYEYKTGEITLKANQAFYVKTLDNSKSWGPYTVKTTESYKLYFSEEYLWGVDTEKVRNVYIKNLTTTIYFSNNKGWSSVYAYVWDSATDQPQVSWPGTQMSYVSTNEYGESIYSINVDTSKYDSIIFTDNKGNQTVDITIGSDNGYYCTDKNSAGKYGYGTYTYSS